MENKTDKLNQFFEQVKALTFWKIIFGWSQFRNLSYDAYQEFKSLLSQVSHVTQESSQLKSDNLVLKNDNEHLKNKQHDLEKELVIINDRANSLSKESITLSARILFSNRLKLTGRRNTKAMSRHLI